MALTPLSLLDGIARVVGLAVTGLLATIVPPMLWFGVMTDCTSTYGCTRTGCDPCSGASALLTGHWVLQGVLLVVAVALWFDVVRRLRPTTLLVVAVAVPVTSIVLLVGTARVADQTYCRPGQDSTGYTDYCDVR